MITIKNRTALLHMAEAGKRLESIFLELAQKGLQEEMTTLSIDSWISQQLSKAGMVSAMRGYQGYKHVSCISINEEVVHGVPSNRSLKPGDLVKVDVCASFNGYCADMARCFVVGDADETTKQLITACQNALDKGIEQMYSGKRLSDISHAIQIEIERHGFGVVVDFAGHGIGKRMHEDPEIVNYGRPGSGPLLATGMTFALEPMITAGSHEVVVQSDGWTVVTKDGTRAAHVEDTVAITEHGPVILTRHASRKELK